ncbi:MAG: hypothetical protein WCE44_16640 [Candidatus Velthaea sp.]|jgi:hypothetical protein
MLRTISIDVAGTPQIFELNFDDDTWRADRSFDEGDFPLVAEVDGRRYELYSDQTLSEEELL